MEYADQHVMCRKRKKRQQKFMKILLKVLPVMSHLDAPVGIEMSLVDSSHLFVVAQLCQAKSLKRLVGA